MVRKKGYGKWMNTMTVGPRSYVWAIAYGLYYYALFQLLFLLRFGTLNFTFTLADLGLWAVGIGSVWMGAYFCNKLRRGKAFLVIPFLVAIPFSVVGTLGGGLLGMLGILLFGLIPFAALLPIGYGITRYFVAQEVELRDVS